MKKFSLVTENNDVVIANTLKKTFRNMPGIKSSNVMFDDKGDHLAFKIDITFDGDVKTDLLGTVFGQLAGSTLKEMKYLDNNKKIQMLLSRPKNN